MHRRTLLRGGGVALAGLAGCLGGGSGGDSTPKAAVRVESVDVPREGDGTLSVRFRPATYDAFTWAGADGQFYGADEGFRYLVVQCAVSARGRPLNHAFGRGLDLLVDGEELYDTAHVGDIEGETPLPPGTTVTGWRAWEVPADAGTATLTHSGFDLRYRTTFERDDDLEMGVRPYDEG